MTWTSIDGVRDTTLSPNNACHTDLVVATYNQNSATTSLSIFFGDGHGHLTLSAQGVIETPLTQALRHLTAVDTDGETGLELVLIRDDREEITTLENQGSRQMDSFASTSLAADNAADRLLPGRFQALGQLDQLLMQLVEL